MTDKKQNIDKYDLDKLMTRKSFMDKIIEYFLDSADKTTFSGKDKILFYKELVYMMKGGVPLLEAMRTIQTTIS